MILVFVFLFLLLITFVPIRKTAEGREGPDRLRHHQPIASKNGLSKRNLTVALTSMPSTKGGCVPVNKV